MLIVAGTMRVPADRIEALRPAMAAVIAASRADSGCIAYGFAEDVLDPGLIHVFERWESAETLAAHGQAPHMVPWRAACAEAGLGERKLMVYEAGEGAPL